LIRCALAVASTVAITAAADGEFAARAVTVSGLPAPSASVGVEDFLILLANLG
jgi:hypothetical protein